VDLPDVLNTRGAAEAPPPVCRIHAVFESSDATPAKAVAAGPQVCVPKTPIPGTGWFAMILDPENIPVGLFETL